MPRFQNDNFQANQKLVIELKKFAEHKKCSMAQLALAWILHQSKNIVPIPGSKRIKHLEDNLGALTVQLFQDDLVKLNELFPLNSAQGEKYPEAFQTEG